MPTSPSHGPQPTAWHEPDARRLRILVERATEGYFEVDASGGLVFFNQAFGDLLSSCVRPVLGQAFGDLFEPSTKAAIQSCLAAATSTGIESRTSPFTLDCGSDPERRLEIAFGPLAVEQPAMGAYGFVRDLTDQLACRSEAQQCTTDLSQADQRSQQRFQTFLDFLPDPVCVFNHDDSVNYLNPAFERVFGWSFEELVGHRLHFVPPDEKEHTRQGLAQLEARSIIHGFQSKRLTKDGRLRDVIIEAAVYLDERNRSAGKVVVLRDVTREKRMERTNLTLSRITLALHQHHELKSLLDFITGEIRSLIGVEGASVILLDEKRREFFFPVTAYEDEEAGRRLRKIRLPADKGVVGHVYRTGKPLIVPDTSKNDLFLKEPDMQAGYRSQNLLDVPLRHHDRMIGVLMAVNKKEGPFDQEDVDLMMSVAGLVALPLENAHMHHELVRSYDQVKQLNQAKDRVIHHLSHELKTPVAIMKASLKVLKEKFVDNSDESLASIMARTERNLNRILDMQYEIEDMLSNEESQHQALMTFLLDSCRDALEALSADHPAAGSIHKVLQERVDALFGPREIKPRMIPLARFVADWLQAHEPAFAHRRLNLVRRFESEAPVYLPEEVLEKIVGGLIRNAVEYTPDKGRIVIGVTDGRRGPELIVQDHGVGMTEEKQRLILENYFSPDDPLGYASKQPYEFNAGGRGFDLLRMTIFSERYDFKIKIASKRCPFVSSEENNCPGDIAACGHCHDATDCHDAGGTRVTIEFKAVPG